MGILNWERKEESVQDFAPKKAVKRGILKFSKSVSVPVKEYLFHDQGSVMAYFEGSAWSWGAEAPSSLAANKQNKSSKSE